MPGAYSADLRQRVLRACERGGLSRAAGAAMFAVGETTVYGWLQAWRAEGRREAKPHAGGPAPRLDAAALDELKGMVAESNDLTLAEYAARLADRTGVRVSGSTVCRALRGLDLPRKKDAAGAGAGPARCRRGSGDLARRAGRDRPTAAGVPRRERRRPPSDPGLRARRARATGAREGAPGPLEATDRDWGARPRRRGGQHERRRGDRHTAVFLAFVEQALIPALRERPDAIVVMDNLAAHKAERVRAALDAAGVGYRYLPAYSPDLNPIEPCWSKLKGWLRAKAARSLEALEAELGPALAAITARDARGWFRLAGYAAPN